MADTWQSCVIGTTHVSAAARAGFGNFLDAASSASRGVLLTDGTSWIWDVLRENERSRNWDIWPVVPDVAGYVRETTDFGMLGAGWRRLRRTSPLSFCQLSLRVLPNLHGVLRRDFSTFLNLMLEIEVANYRWIEPKVVFLHAQIVDLLLALDHGAALKRAIDCLRVGFKAEPGLATNNLGNLLSRLRIWELDVPYLLTPLHPCGYGMRPTQRLCEEKLRAFKGRVIATLDTPLDTSVAAYWRTQETASAVYDVAEPQVAEWRYWRALRG